jgi:hypothetical protein
MPPVILSCSPAASQMRLNARGDEAADTARAADGDDARHGVIDPRRGGAAPEVVGPLDLQPVEAVPASSPSGVGGWNDPQTDAPQLPPVAPQVWFENTESKWQTSVTPPSAFMAITGLVSAVRNASGASV